MDFSGVRLSGMDLSLLNQFAAQFANASCAVNSAVNNTVISLSDCSFVGHMSSPCFETNEIVDVVTDCDG